MFLNAYVDDQWHNAETAQEVTSLLSEVIAALKHESDHPLGAVNPGTIAVLCFADERFSHKDWGTNGAKGNLVIAVNKETGYGALMWDWGPGDDQVWVSDNPEPPDFDPRVVADPGYPLFHDPASTLPIQKFREVLEEFCFAGTGERPTGVRWVRSDPCGRREDRLYPLDWGDTPSPEEFASWSRADPSSGAEFTAEE